MKDVGTYPFKQAAHYRAGRTDMPRLVVVHDMEMPEKAETAELVQTYFARPDSRVASTHLCVDGDTVVRCVHDADTAYGAKGANADGLHVEHAGYQRQTPSEWVDVYSRSMLRLSARAVAAWCLAYQIPAVRLTPEQVKAGARGICGHADITAAYPPGTGHTDPGTGFPWGFYLDLVKLFMTPAQPVQPSPHSSNQEDVMASLDEVRQVVREEIAAAMKQNHAEHVLILRGDDKGHAGIKQVIDRLDARGVTS